MAAVLSKEQVLEKDHETCEPNNDQIIRGKLVDLVDNFDGGLEFNHRFFCDIAVGLLTPVA